MKRPHSFVARDVMRPYRAVGPVPWSPAPVLPLCPPAAARHSTGQLLDVLKGLIGQQVSLQVGNLVHKGKLVSVDPLILLSGDQKACFIRSEAILAIEF